MGIGDEAKDLSGKAKEGLGDATGNEDLQRSGAKDRAEAAVGKAADAIRDRVDDVKEGAGGLGQKIAGAFDGIKDGLSKDKDDRGDADR